MEFHINHDLFRSFLPKMEEFRLIILVSFLTTNLLDKAESVKLELKTFDEIFGEGWWDKGEAEDLKMPAPTNFGQNVHHQIDRQNTQIGQIEPNSTDQLGQIEPNSTDQNPPLTESDHFDNVNNGEEINSNENIAENERKRKIVAKFHVIKEELKQKGKFPWKERTQIEKEIAKHLKVNRPKIYKWKNELDLSRRNPKKERKHLIEKFDQMKADLKRDGFKNSYPNQIYKTVAKELGLSLATIYKWKHKLGQTTPKHIYSNSEQKELMKCYYEIKDKTPKIKDEEIAKMLKIGIATLYRWKKKFERHQLLPNSVVGHSVEENAAANIQEIGHSNSGKPNYSDDEKLKIVKKLMQMESAHSGEDKKSCKEIVERFGVNVGTINKWKKQFGLSQRRKNLIEKFDQMKAELKRAGFKNSYSNQINETVAKELGLSVRTISNWKSELGQTTPNKYSDSEQKELIKHYYEIKDKTPKMSVGDIAKSLNISRATLYKWKNQFKRHQFYPNSVDGHSVEVNATANIQEIGNSNSGSI